jgi:hypothetical protein
MLAALHHTKNLFAPLAADKQPEQGAEVSSEDLSANVSASPNCVVPAEAGTHAEASEPHQGNEVADPECLSLDSRGAAEACAENDSSPFKEDGAVQFEGKA